MIDYIVQPLVGAFIGWLTNGLAIKMLFRPLYPKYIGRWKLPFTPGLIPKEKDRLARSIGAVSQSLVNDEAMKRALLSETMLKDIENYMDVFIVAQKENPESLRSFLSKLLSEEVLNDILEKGKVDVAKVIHRKLSDSTFSGNIADRIVEQVLSKISNVGAFLGLGKLGNAGGLMDIIKHSVRDVLSKSIYSILKNNSEEIVYKITEDGIEQLLVLPVCKIMNDKEQEIRKIKSYILSAYVKGVEYYLPQVMSCVNIARIVENSVAEMDVKEVEQMLFKVMDKELNAIIWLGALLGLLMGFINVLI